MTGSLLAWHGQHRRQFPWRSTRDPWSILVSEVMSQQTQIDRVAARYVDFLERFPTPATTATATTAELLTAWSGLGYNRRALNLQAAAKLIARDGWPTTAAGLEALPGVGPYTAAAVACFAFDEQIAAVDTNVKRILSRWAGESLAGQALDQEANRRLPHGRARDWNSALMDFGALVCKPRPQCAACPVVEQCGDPSVYVPPARQPKFEGSVRQARGAVIKVLIDGHARRLGDLQAATGHDLHRLETAVTALCADGVVCSGTDGYVLAGD